MALFVRKKISPAPAFTLKITRKKARYLKLRACSATSIELVLPWFVPKSYGLRFVEQKKNWIEKALRQYRQRHKTTFSFQGVIYELALYSGKVGTVHFSENKVIIGAKTKSEAQKYFREFLRKEAQKILPDELREISKRLDISFQKLSLRAQKSRWGSCSARGNISLNIGLMRFRAELRAYIMIHELCHIKEMNHSRKFWELVASFCPEYQKLRRELKNYAPGFTED